MTITMSITRKEIKLTSIQPKVLSSMLTRGHLKSKGNYRQHTSVYPMPHQAEADMNAFKTKDQLETKEEEPRQEKEHLLWRPN